MGIALWKHYRWPVAKKGKARVIRAFPVCIGTTGISCEINPQIATQQKRDRAAEPEGRALVRSRLLQQSELRHSGLCAYEHLAVDDDRSDELISRAKLVAPPAWLLL